MALSPGAHDAEAGPSSQPPPPPVTESSVTQPSELTAILQSLAAGQRRHDEHEAEQSRRFEASQMRLQEELLRQTQRQTEMINSLHQQQQTTSHAILQQQHGTTQMFTWLAGCIGVLYQNAGLAPPAPPQLQVPPTATTPLPSVVGGFQQIPIAPIPQSPLLQTGVFPPPVTSEGLWQSVPPASQVEQGQFS